MSIGVGAVLRTLVVGAVLAAAPVAAQTPAGGTWTDPPARAVAPPPPVSAPAAKASEANPPDTAAKTTDIKTTDIKTTDTRAAAVGPGTDKNVVLGTRIRGREARRVRPRVLAEASRAPRRVVERRQAQPIRRVAARSFAPRYVEAPAYAGAPLPVGRVEGPVYGARDPIFSDGDDRARRIAAAQAAGYLVVRSRSVQFPDGRSLRTYRPYEGADDLD